MLPRRLQMQIKYAGDHGDSEIAMQVTILAGITHATAEMIRMGFNCVVVSSMGYIDISYRCCRGIKTYGVSIVILHGNVTLSLSNHRKVIYECRCNISHPMLCRRLADSVLSYIDSHKFNGGRRRWTALPKFDRTTWG